MWNPDQIEAPDKKVNSHRLKGTKKQKFKEARITNTLRVKKKY